MIWPLIKLDLRKALPAYLASLVVMIGFILITRDILDSTNIFVIIMAVIQGCLIACFLFSDPNNTRSFLFSRPWSPTRIFWNRWALAVILQIATVLLVYTIIAAGTKLSILPHGRALRALDPLPHSHSPTHHVPHHHVPHAQEQSTRSRCRRQLAGGHCQSCPWPNNDLPRNPYRHGRPRLCRRRTANRLPALHLCRSSGCTLHRRVTQLLQEHGDRVMTPPILTTAATALTLRRPQ